MPSVAFLQLVAYIPQRSSLLTFRKNQVRWVTLGMANTPLRTTPTWNSNKFAKGKDIRTCSLSPHLLPISRNSFNFRQLGTLGHMKVYTKTGDKGTTGLFSGERRPKDDPIFEALGAVDELNASIGLALEFLHNHESIRQTQLNKDAQARNKQNFGELSGQLEEIMSRLFDVGAAVATPRNSDTVSDSRLRRTEFDDANVEKLERWIDKMDEQLDPITRFILPSGGLAAAQLHISRTLARTAERRVWTLVKQGGCDEVVARFLNRLSDYLFVSARFACKITGGNEKFWQQAPKLRQEQEP